MSPQFQHNLIVVVLELGYLAAGLVLCYFGKGMIEKGLTTEFRADGSLSASKLRIATSSPGLVFMLAGLIVVGLAIRTQAYFAQGPSGAETEGTLPAAAMDTAWERLAAGLFVSRLAEQSPEDAFARGQLDAAREAVARGETDAALARLAGALVVSPPVLRAALDDAELRPLLRDPRVVAIARERWKLAMTFGAEGQASGNHPLMGQVAAYAHDHARGEDVSDLVAEFPGNAGREPVTVTAQRLRTVLARSPRALYALLRNPRYRWILDDAFLARELVTELNALQSAGGSPAPGSEEGA